MIKGLQGGNGVIVDNGNTSLQYVNQDTNNPLQGMVRVWGSDLQVFSNGSWSLMASSYATVRLDPETASLLEWARKKKEEEQAMWTSPGDHPAVLAAKEHFNRAKADMIKAEKQLKATVILSKEYDQTTN